MFTAIYSFKVFEGKDEEFIHSWRTLTKLIYEHENSFGSRLHKASDNLYIAYAMWPNKETWQNAGHNLPISANEFKALMKESCSQIKTEYELETIDDLIKSKQFMS